MSSDLLTNRVLDALRPIKGDKLAGVTYWALENEILSADQFEDPELYLGGEVEIRFLKCGQLFVGWDENAGWSHHFSLQARNSSTFLSNTLVPWSADKIRGWASLVGSRVSSVAVLGYEDVPHVAALRFGATTVYIGDGSQNTFCDGDDVLIRIGESDPQLCRLSVLWTNEDAAGEL